MDDSFVVLKREMISKFHVILNSVYPDIHFTMEAGDAEIIGLGIDQKPEKRSKHEAPQKPPATPIRFSQRPTRPYECDSINRITDKKSDWSR
ncbi:unnamed protein product [Schistocephalus solidus]|uniref:Uncharacterized protein n=1 Tax=Schistocephalus solidus TaxID=70667 RepID=A0A183TMS2_SCHSO|nr:unnamed protein product [Schistocephalus solidus]